MDRFWPRAPVIQEAGIKPSQATFCTYLLGESGAWIRRLTASPSSPRTRAHKQVAVKQASAREIAALRRHWSIGDHGGVLRPGGGILPRPSTFPVPNDRLELRAEMFFQI